MLKIKNIDCQYLQLSSDLIRDIILHPEKYTSVVGTGKINCGITLDLFVDYPNNNTFWKYKLAKNVAKEDILSKITFKNIITNEVFDLDGLSLDMSSADDTDFDGVITDLLTNYGLDDSGLLVEIITMPGITGDVLKITGLPDGIIPYTMEFSTTTEVFYFSYSTNDDFFISSDYMYIKPLPWLSTEFANGIHYVKIVATLLDGSKKEESQCFFVDCNIKCRVAALLEHNLENDIFDSLVEYYYRALERSGECGGCNCEFMCEVYTRLVALLDNANISDIITAKSCCNGCN